MKTIAIFEETKPVTVQRLEGDLKVGERSVYMVDFIESLTEELSIGSLVSKLVERAGELSGYFKEVSYWNDRDQMSRFLSALFENASTRSYENNEALQRVALLALSKLNLADPTQEEVLGLLKNMLAKVDELTVNSALGELTLALAKKMLCSDEKQVNDFRKELSKSVAYLLDDDATIKNTIQNLLPRLDRNWVMQTLQSDTQNNSVLAQTTVPKNCVFMQMGTAFNTYVLEVPKARIRVKYYDTAFEDVGHPRMLCILKTNADGIFSMKMVAIHEKATINLNMPVYHYPYSNVFPDGKVCWHGYREKGMAENLSQIPNIFLSTTNNSHLNGNVRMLFEQYAGKDFDDSTLKPMASLEKLL